MRRPINRNLGKHPLDPEYHDDYDYEELRDQYEMELEMEQDERRGERQDNQ